MRVAVVVAMVALTSCSEVGDREHFRIAKKAIADCESLGGRPEINVGAVGHIYYKGCDFSLNRERERREREGKLQPKIGTPLFRSEQ